MNNELDQAAVRTWLKEMPDAGVFNDKCWLAYDEDGDWYIHAFRPINDLWNGDWHSSHYCELDSDFFNLPTLEGDQWKYSCISVIELAEWQMEQVK